MHNKKNDNAGYHHNIDKSKIRKIYNEHEISGEGWHFNRREISGIVYRSDLSDLVYEIYYREDEEEVFIIVSDNWAIEVPVEDLLEN